MQDPELYLTKIGITLPGFFVADIPAELNPDHRSIVNFESYFFSDREAKARFDQNMIAYCGPLTDPVTLQRFRPHANSPRMVYNDRLYLFSSDSAKTVFATMPDMYWLPNLAMLPRADSTEAG